MPRFAVPLAIPLALCLLAACTGGGGDDTGTPGTSPAARGLPEGQSTWSGTGEIGGLSFPVELSLTNSGGDLAGEVTLAEDPEQPLGIGTARFSVEGTHAPASGRFALVPVAWIDEAKIAIELVGATGSYDPDAGTLTGQLRDWSSAADNTLQGGPFTLSLVSGDGEASSIGDQEKSLPGGSLPLAGTMQCTSAVRDVEGTVTYDGEGGITGSLTVGDPGLDTPLGTFPFDGVHNPTTGTITVAPQPWDDPVPSTATFMVSGPYSPSTAAWTGSQATNTAACPPDTWNTTIGG